MFAPPLGRPRRGPSCDRAHDLRASLGLLVALAARLSGSSGVSRDASCGSPIDCRHCVRDGRRSGLLRAPQDDREKRPRDPGRRRRGRCRRISTGFGRSPLLQSSFARELGLGTSPVIITVTRMTRHKGIPTLLKAAALVHRVRPDVKFLLVGPRESEGPLAVTQAEIDQHAPYVVATGPRSDVPALLRLADAFCVPDGVSRGRSSRAA